MEAHQIICKVKNSGDQEAVNVKSGGQERNSPKNFKNYQANYNDRQPGGFGFDFVDPNSLESQDEGKGKSDERKLPERQIQENKKTKKTGIK
jgi:hypothetical protein